MTEGRFRALRGCLVILLLIGTAAFFISKLDPIKGEFIDGVYLPDADGGKVWFQTDGSFHFLLQSQSPRSFSRSTKTLFNKTYSYLYDPAGEKVVRTSRKKYPLWSSPPHPKMFHIRNAVWLVTPPHLNFDTGQPHDVNIEAIDPSTGAQVFDFSTFIARFPQLKSGIASLYIHDIPTEPLRFDFKTKDGQEFLYYPDEDALFETQQEYRNHVAKAKPLSTAFVLSSDDRAELYRLTGPLFAVMPSSFSSSVLKDDDHLRTVYKVAAAPVTPAEAYLKGIILYQDTDAVVILHQTQIGKGAERLLTAVDATGKKRWTLTQKDLFKELAIDDDDPFSEIFFMKSEIRGQQSGGLFVLKMDGVGMMGIDLTTGAVLWTMKAK